MKKLILAVMLSVLLLGFSSISHADSILMPYIQSNPGNLSTIVNIINTTNNFTACPGLFLDTLRLHYWYFYKDNTLAPVDACGEVDFWRPTTLNDLVSFDCSGLANGGNALFNDATDYNAGTGAPAFDLPHTGTATPSRGYLLVNHYCEGLTNADIPLYTGDLDGETILVDVVFGAAWGYRGVIANPLLMGPYGFTPIGPAGTTPAVGMTSDLLPEDALGGLANVSPFAAPNVYSQLQAVALYPLDELQTRMMVTPLYIDSAAVAAGTQNNMTNVTPLTQKRTRITFVMANGIDGIMDRNEATASGSDVVHVRCVAGVDIQDMIGDKENSVWFPPQGGWALVDLRDPLVIDGFTEIAMAAGDYNAIVFKLEFGWPSFGAGTPLNSATLIRDGRMW